MRTDIQVIGDKSECRSRYNRDLASQVNEEVNRRIRNGGSVITNKRFEKPLVRLASFSNVAINAKTEESFDQLMKVYACGGWKFGDGLSPIAWRRKINHISDLCVEGFYNLNSANDRTFGFSTKNIYEKLNTKIIEPEIFYKNSYITKGHLTEINEYYDKYVGGRK